MDVRDKRRVLAARAAVEDVEVPEAFLGVEVAGDADPFAFEGVIFFSGFWHAEFGGAVGVDEAALDGYFCH